MVEGAVAIMHGVIKVTVKTLKGGRVIASAPGFEESVEYLDSCLYKYSGGVEWAPTSRIVKG